MQVGTDQHRRGLRAAPITKEFCSFLAISVGSANEMEVHLKIAKEPGYISDVEFEHFAEEYQIIGKQLTRLIQYWRSKGA